MTINPAVKQMMEAVYANFPEQKLTMDKLFAIKEAMIMFEGADDTLKPLIAEHGRRYPMPRIVEKSGRIEIPEGINGEPNRCHANCAIYHKQHPEYRVVTGYALMDTFWVRHSWLTKNGNDTIETVGFAYKLYFGVELYGEALETFNKTMAKLPDQ